MSRYMVEANWYNDTHATFMGGRGPTVRWLEIDWDDGTTTSHEDDAVVTTSAGMFLGDEQIWPPTDEALLKHIPEGTMRRALADGAAAFADGLPVSSNPHDGGAEFAWITGWWRAQFESWRVSTERAAEEAP